MTDRPSAAIGQFTVDSDNLNNLLDTKFDRSARTRRISEQLANSISEGFVAFGFSLNGL